MTISVINPVQATWIFAIIFALALAISARSRKNEELFPLSLTRELKGVALLAVVFSHIGYFLATDHRFMFPLSVMAGVGVNLYLFLSGYGLTVGGLKKTLSIWQFYRRRLPKLFVPFWLVMALFLVMDYFILNISYSGEFLSKAFFGIFTHADLYNDLNSPLWYITLTVLYYLVFPFFFSKKRPWLSAAIIYGITYAVVRYDPPMFKQVMFLFRTHIMAFPIGMIFAWLFTAKPAWAVGLLNEAQRCNVMKKLWENGRYVLMTALIALICYTAYYSGVGQTANKEQLISMTTVLSFVVLFILMRVEFRLLSILGLFSYEIYLLHWPLMYRFDIFYRFLPAWLATVLYFVLFLGLAWLLNKLIGLMQITKKTKSV